MAVSPTHPNTQTVLFQPFLDRTPADNDVSTVKHGRLSGCHCALWRFEATLYQCRIRARKQAGGSRRAIIANPRLHCKLAGKLRNGDPVERAGSESAHIQLAVLADYYGTAGRL